MNAALAPRLTGVIVSPQNHEGLRTRDPEERPRREPVHDPDAGRLLSRSRVQAEGQEL